MHLAWRASLFCPLERRGKIAESGIVAVYLRSCTVRYNKHDMVTNVSSASANEACRLQLQYVLSVSDNNPALSGRTPYRKGKIQTNGGVCLVFIACRPSRLVFVLLPFTTKPRDISPSILPSRLPRCLCSVEARPPWRTGFSSTSTSRSSIT